MIQQLVLNKKDNRILHMRKIKYCDKTFQIIGFYERTIEKLAATARIAKSTFYFQRL